MASCVQNFECALDRMANNLSGDMSDEDADLIEKVIGQYRRYLEHDIRELIDELNKTKDQRDKALELLGKASSILAISKV